MLDPIADMLSRIRSAQMAGKSEVFFRASKIKMAVSNILEQEGFIEAASQEKNNDNKETIRVVLKYNKVSNTEKMPAIREIKRISREGNRVYIKKQDIRKIKNDFGIAIISTSRGVMTGEGAKKNGLGGEYICEVW